MSITKIDEIKAKQIIEVPLRGWGIDDVFNVKLKNFSLLEVASKGKIPNPLIGPVLGLFQGKGMEIETVEGLKTFKEVVDFFCDVCLVEPTYKELKDNGINLTDDQRNAIYNFATRGAKSLIPFLEKSANINPSDNGEDIQENSK